jgi:hypothetical protein
MKKHQVVQSIPVEKGSGNVYADLGHTISALLKGRSRGTSEHRLMERLTRLGRDIHMVIKPALRSRPNGRPTLSVAKPYRRCSPLA